jgi:hypothetical protein
LISCSACSSNLKMEATYFSETSLDFQRTTRRYIREDNCSFQWVWRFSPAVCSETRIDRKPHSILLS